MNQSKSIMIVIFFFISITIRLAKTSISDLMQIFEVTRGFEKPVKNWYL